jgi:hypothetical protein
MREAIHAHLGTRQVARVIYGAIIGLALVVVLEAHPPGAASAAVSMIGTGVAVGLAELYSEVVGAETRTRTRVQRESLAEMIDDSVAVFFGASFPAVFFIAASAGLLTLDTAFTVAKWTGLGLIGFYGFAAARLAGAGALTCLIQAVGAVLIGAILIALKALLH